MVLHRSCFVHLQYISPHIPTLPQTLGCILWHFHPRVFGSVERRQPECIGELEHCQGQQQIVGQLYIMTCASSPHRRNVNCGRKCKELAITFMTHPLKAQTCLHPSSGLNGIRTGNKCVDTALLMCAECQSLGKNCALQQASSVHWQCSCSVEVVTTPNRPCMSILLPPFLSTHRQMTSSSVTRWLAWACSAHAVSPRNNIQRVKMITLTSGG